MLQVPKISKYGRPAEVAQRQNFARNFTCRQQKVLMSAHLFRASMVPPGLHAEVRDKQVQAGCFLAMLQLLERHTGMLPAP